MTDALCRETHHAIDELFIRRWSPRAFDGSKLEEGDLFRLFEAARWAPSAFNVQPWRFLYALRDGPDWERFLGLLIPFNRSWAEQAAALVIVLSDSQERNSDGTAKSPSHSHSFDAGAAWGMFALQATIDGLHTHGMTGVNFEKIRNELNVPEDYRVEAAIAVGRLGDPANLPESLRDREKPSDRKPVSDFAFSGSFPSR